MLATLNWNIHFRAKHIPGKHNITADRLSRSSFSSLPAHASAKSRTNANSRNPVGTLTTEAQNLLAAALSDNTKTAYKRTWGLFIQYFPCITSIPLSPTVLCNFIAKLFSLGYSPSSISSHVSAISYVHKILNLQDPAEAFLVKKILQGCHHSAPSKDSRLPVTGPILANMLRGINTSIQNLYTKWLLKSIFLLAFNVVKTKTDQCKVIQRSDITFEMSHATPVAVVIVLRNFKTNKTHDLFQIHLKASGNEDMCPVKTLYTYVQTFGHKSGPLFSIDGR